MGLTAQQQESLNKIVIGSDNDPENPEYPPHAPKFPATPTYKIQVDGFDNVWLKDESYNQTGTHKDRLAREIVVTYRNFLLAKKKSTNTGDLLSMSIISSGSAAIAIQTALKKYGLPNLKVLIDHHIDEVYISKLESLDAELYYTDLSKRELLPDDILELTKNQDGFDITCGIGFDPTVRFYDWLSYEILNENPEYCFIPYGTGNLYENILNVLRCQITKVGKHDPRFFGSLKILENTHFLGATTADPNSFAQKLYSDFLPFKEFASHSLDFYKKSGFCGNLSQIYNIQEKFIRSALEIIKSQGIQAEASGVAGLALLLQMGKQIPSNAKILIVNTGKTKL